MYILYILGNYHGCYIGISEKFSARAAGRQPQEIKNHVTLFLLIRKILAVLYIRSCDIYYQNLCHVSTTIPTITHLRRYYDYYRICNHRNLNLRLSKPKIDIKYRKQKYYLSIQIRGGCIFKIPSTCTVQLAVSHKNTIMILLE